MPNTKGIYIGLLNQGSLRAELVNTVSQMTRQGKYNINVHYSAKKPIAYNRNLITKKFLETPGYDYMIQIDSDIVPPLKLLDLADFQKDIIGTLCFAWRDKAIVPLILDENTPEFIEKTIEEMKESKTWTQEREDIMKKGLNKYHVKNIRGREGLVECDAVGTGCIIIKREVLEHPYWQKSGGWFRNEYDEGGIKTTGLDLAFCRRAKKLGYKVYAHLDYACSHITNFDLKEIYASLLEGEEDKGRVQELEQQLKKQ